MKTLLVSTASILIVLIQSCGATPNKWDLLGRWVSNNGASITLYRDSTFIAKNLPSKIFIEYDSSGLFDGYGI